MRLIDDPHTLGPLEQEVMDVLWRKNPLTVQDVLNHINARSSRDLAYTTVMTIMTRLCDKRVLQRKKDGRSYYYQPRMTKHTFLRQLASNTLDHLARRFGDEAVAAFAEEAGKQA